MATLTQAQNSGGIITRPDAQIRTRFDTFPALLLVSDTIHLQAIYYTGVSHKASVQDRGRLRALDIFTIWGYALLKTYLDKDSMELLTTVTGYLDDLKKPLRSTYVVWKAIQSK